MTYFSDQKPVNPTSIKKRVGQITCKAVKIHSRPEALKKIISVTDLTSLRGDERKEEIRTLCKKARTFEALDPRIPNVAAVCIYPSFISIALKELSESEVLVATVAGGFPGGDIPQAEKILEVRKAVDAGAEEVDMVLHLPKFFEGKYNEVQDEISAIKTICKDVTLKVIIETGALGSLSNVQKASELAILGGADFLKTSTGKIEPAASLDSFLVMLDTIKAYYDQTGIMIGIKAAGGIRQPVQAFQYLSLVYDVLGGLWITPEYFRIGASQLVDHVVSELQQSDPDSHV